MPILDSQLRYARELAHIVRHENQVARPRLARNQYVVPPNRGACRRQLRANVAGC